MPPEQNKWQTITPGTTSPTLVQTYFWASNAYILKTNLVTPNFFTLVSLSFENKTTWSFKKIYTKRILYKRSLDDDESRIKNLNEEDQKTAVYW